MPPSANPRQAVVIISISPLCQSCRTPRKITAVRAQLADLLKGFDFDGEVSE